MKDLTGLAISASNSEIVELYNQAVFKLLLFQNPVDDSIRIIEQDPGFVMGQVFNAYINLWGTDKDDWIWAKQAVDRILAQGIIRLTPREKLHINAVEFWLKGDMRSASRALDSLSLEYPKDLLALMSGHQLDFFLGDAPNLRGRVARALSAWDKEDPLYGPLLGMYSFGLEEAGDYARAEEAGRESVARNPKDIWGIHAVAHVLDMQGRYDEGAEFMQQYEPYWSSDNIMISHNAIHYEIFLLEQNRLDTIIANYDRDVHQPGCTPVPMALVDASSVLWRLFLEGIDVGDRFKHLANSWDEKKDQTFYVFNDAHAIMAYLGAGRDNSAQDLLNHLEDYALKGDPQSNNLSMTQRVGLPVSRGLYAFAHGDYDRAIDELLPVRYYSNQFGGSHVQRDVLERTLMEAAIKSGNRPLARGLIAERLESKPRSPYNLRKQEAVLAMG